MSLGGDGTFLKTASMINSDRVPIFGVNTDPSRSVGHLTSIYVPFEERQTEGALQGGLRGYYVRLPKHVNL